MTAHNSKCRELTREEFATFQSTSTSSIRLAELNKAIKRVCQCQSRLQLLWPGPYRCGCVLNFLAPFIKANTNIVSFSCAFYQNYGPGLDAVSEIMQASRITKYYLDIENLSYPTHTEAFFAALSTAKIREFSIKLKLCSDENMKLLCTALIQNDHIQKLEFFCPSFSDAGIRYFAEIISNPQSKIRALSLSVNDMNTEHVNVLCDEGLKHSSAILTNLNIESCTIREIGMTKVVRTLRSCSNIKNLTIGANGTHAMRAFFTHFSDMRYIEKLVCCDFGMVDKEHVDLNLVAASLKRIFENTECNKLATLILPLFIYNETCDESLELFVNALIHPNNHLRVLQLFPLHIPRNDLAPYTDRNNKIAHFFKLLFYGLSTSKYLQKLYIELIGSESFMFNESVANAFMHFLQRSHVHELYLPLYCLIDYNVRILDMFQHCERLVSIKDHSIYSKGSDDAERERKLLKAAEYHDVVHKQCRKNVADAVRPFIGLRDLAVTISTFCDLDANCDDWLM